MKRLILTILLIASLLCCVSCASSEAPADTFAQKIIGAWEITYNGDTSYYVFNEDGTAYSFASFGVQLSIKYSVIDEDTVHLKYTSLFGEEISEDSEITVDGDKMMFDGMEHTRCDIETVNKVIGEYSELVKPLLGDWLSVNESEYYRELHFGEDCRGSQKTSDGKTEEFMFGIYSEGNVRVILWDGRQMSNDYDYTVDGDTLVFSGVEYARK